MKQIHQNIIDEIKKHDTIIIHRHTRPDGDCMGSQVGLKEIILNSFSNKSVYMVGDEAKQFHELGRMDKIDDGLYKDALVIIVDVSNIARISDARFNLGKTIIKIDHHPKVEDVCEIEWIDTTYASCCEMLVDFYYHNQDILKMNEKAAKVLYYGIITDTSRFLSPAINSRTLFLASLLLKYPIDTNQIYEHIFDEHEKMTRLRGYVATHFTLTRHGLGYILMDKDLTEELEIDANISNVLVNTLSNTSQVKIYFIAIFDEPSQKFRVSLRSKELPINQFAEKYGGGGHKNASGIFINKMEDVKHLIHDLEDYLENIK